MSILIIVILLVAGAYAAGVVAVTIHTNIKFAYYVSKWREARQVNDHTGMILYCRCAALAHEDTWALGKSPLKWKRRWNVDYEQEARAEAGKASR